MEAEPGYDVVELEPLVEDRACLVRVDVQYPQPRSGRAVEPDVRGAAAVLALRVDRVTGGGRDERGIGDGDSVSVGAAHVAGRREPEPADEDAPVEEVVTGRDRG